MLRIFSFIGGLGIVLLVFGLFWIPGPNIKQIDQPTTFANLQDAKAQIDQRELSLNKMRPENEKKFFLQKNEATPHGIVYIPGFSATRREISPVVENVAENLKANLFMSRLTGHGQTAEEFATIRAENFISDGLEAIGIGRVLGQKKIWIATSTGALVALEMASRYPDQIAALIFISPLFDLFDSKSRLLPGYAGPLMQKLIVGTYRQWKPLNQEQEKYWHTRYRAESLIALTRLVAWVKDIDKGKFQIPLLIFYTPQDQIISIKAVEEVFNQWGTSQKKMISVTAKDHVLTGDVVSPENTALVTDEIISWLNQLK